MRIGNVEIGAGRRPFIIAEMSGNHDGQLERALRIVDVAADSGAQAVKLQTYTADTMTLDSDANGFVVDEPDSLWYGRKLYDLYDEAHTPLGWHAPIMQHAKDRGILCFSSPFDSTAVEFLEDLGVPCFKIASLENVDHPLIQAVAATGKPVIISTGASNEEEIDEAVQVARDAGCRDLVLLKCTSGYPTPPEESNLLTIPYLKSRFGCEVGFSDHTMGIGVAVAAVALGATVIEKHVTDDRSAGGVDSAFSSEPHELARLVEEADRGRRSLGSIVLEPTEAERGARIRKRSVYIAKNISAGDVLTAENLRRIRPGHGLHPKHYVGLLGRRVNRDVKAGTPMAWDLLQD